ncbi:D-alanyl-D-alanine carboxypeptidase family protein [Streptomyces sp. 3214.6]|uniref:D-alanyl-D-alanine carboxypeptidase family protein n=1 Tax=Streptomyces sp. 3214.6 TaxID=1882757 RepID=UPI0009A824C9|nr:D-alanyl-D-alanine carboxypeptidase [Streptomyces sp. 3214.6]
MEEASVAGESPDRSKQRESSAEPTSGSAGAVPDPRVAASTPRGGVDTATRVFSVRDLKAETPEEPAPAETPDELTASGTTEEPGEAGKAAETAAAEKPAKVGAPRTAARTGETEAADEVEDEDENEDGDEDGDGDEDEVAGDAAETPEDANPAKADASGKSEKSEEAGESGADAADREAVAAASEGVGGASRGSKGVEEGSGGSEAVGGGDERLRAAVAQWVASADEKGSDEGSADADDGAKERSESDAGAAEAKPASQAVSKSAPKWAAGADEDEDDEPKSDKAESDKAESDSDGSDKAESGKAADGGDGSGVDQPTAVFKAPRPKPAVDQPTTMLKLGGATKPKPESDKADTKPDADKADTKPKPDADKAGAEPEADAPAERTSKFVALKPLDEPRPLKPAAKASPEVTALVPQIGPERTTQQPLPPKPPLDLLAELTNTPPPPPTPLRTLGRRIKIWTPLVLLLVVVFAIAQAVRPLPTTALTLTAKGSYTFEGGKTQLPWPGEGQGWIDVDGVGTMGSFGQQKPVAIGSVAKTMTAYIILKDHPMKAGEEGPKIEIDATAEKEGGYDVTGDESTLNTVKAGDFLTEKQALSAVLIPSANNIARLLARWDAGSEAAFVKKMNATAKALGMTRTTYTDPSGLKETTVSTAEDQVKLGRAFVQVPALVAISSAASWTDPSGKYWNNYNELPFKTGAIGIKTGSTSAAGGNLLFASRKEVNGRSVTLVGAILGQHKKEILATVNAVSKTALLAAQDALTSAKIVKKGEVVGYVDDKLGHHTPVVVTKDVSVVGWAGMTVKLSFVADEVPHTAKAGAQVGTLTVGDGSGSAVKVPVALQTDLVEPGFTDKLTRIG